MGRGRARHRKVVRVEIVDATPERIRMNESEWVNPAEIDSSEQPIGLTRRFRTSHLDRLYKAQAITWPQFYAGESYRSLHERARFIMAIVASYGERTTGGEPTYGLPITDVQLRARKQLSEARSKWPSGMQGYMERLIIHNQFPRYAGRAHTRNLDSVRAALDAMARHFKLGC